MMGRPVCEEAGGGQHLGLPTAMTPASLAGEPAACILPSRARESRTQGSERFRRQEALMPQLERREALPVHPVPAGLTALEDWRLQVDGLVAQPLNLSVSEVEALGAQARTADFLCEEGWVVPEQQW